MEERYLNPHTDFGFKRLFGSEFNKELLISFLNAMFHGEQNVKDVTYLNSEQLGDRIDERRAVFDVYCENDKGEKFIVEMQNIYQEFFKDRTIYYSTFPIREQARRGGDWDFHLNSVYTVGLLNFNFAEGLDDARRWHHEVKLMEVDTKEVFYDKLTYVYVEIPKFNKTEDELETMYDKWMYVLKNLSSLMNRPAALQERVFTRLFEQAEISKFSSDELRMYEDSVNAFRDIVNAIRSAEKKKFAEGRAKGLAEGRAEGLAEIVRAMLAKGMAKDLIAELTGMSVDDINRL
ncbi:Rpn family recombination-promoting nuclease/putative transposase [uncultured Prevotella sp.]|uniref:Rpn family recombination-promoting nuclease/putative transposase n=1 Tax=uncultured Prevotella sp. TaxID=159272 RepID=UPI00261ADFBE|nr:Rpn family recombination-promoting nuclease/putative transposase [uncultured Prevotella sp.]